MVYIGTTGTISSQTDINDDDIQINDNIDGTLMCSICYTQNGAIIEIEGFSNICDNCHEYIDTNIHRHNYHSTNSTSTTNSNENLNNRFTNVFTNTSNENENMSSHHFANAFTNTATYVVDDLHLNELDDIEENINSWLEFHGFNLNSLPPR
jgi:hypothetical protein